MVDISNVILKSNYVARKNEYYYHYKDKIRAKGVTIFVEQMRPNRPFSLAYTAVSLSSSG